MITIDGQLRRLERLQNVVQWGRFQEFDEVFEKQREDLGAFAKLNKPLSKLTSQEQTRRNQLDQAMQQRVPDMEQFLQDADERQKLQKKMITDLGGATLSPAQQTWLERLKKRKDDLDDELEERQSNTQQIEEVRQRKLKQTPESLGMLRHAWGSTFGGLSFYETDRGDYFKITGRGDKNPYTGERTPSDKQIRETILRLVKEQGCDTIYCYKGNKIDPQLTSRTRQILSEMQQSGHILEGQRVSVSTSRMEDVEPWRRDNFLTRYFHDRATNSDHEKALKADAKDIKKEKLSPWMPEWISKLPFT